MKGKGREKGRRRNSVGTSSSSPLSVPVTRVLTAPPPVEPIAARLKEARLQREDFEILKVIGRGAFSEVSPAAARGARTFPARRGRPRGWGPDLRN